MGASGAALGIRTAEAGPRRGDRGRKAVLRATAGATAAMATNITEEHKRDFDALKSGRCHDFRLFSCHVDGAGWRRRYRRCLRP